MTVGTQAFQPVRPAELHSAENGEAENVSFSGGGSGFQTRWAHRPETCVPTILS